MTPTPTEEQRREALDDMEGTRSDEWDESTWNTIRAALQPQPASEADDDTLGAYCAECKSCGYEGCCKPTMCKHLNCGMVQASWDEMVSDCEKYIARIAELEAISP